MRVAIVGACSWSTSPQPRRHAHARPSLIGPAGLPDELLRAPSSSWCGPFRRGVSSTGGCPRPARILHVVSTSFEFNFGRALAELYLHPRAEAGVAGGLPVAIADSGDPVDLELITRLVIPGAEARWAADAVADADLVVLAIPLVRFLAIDAEACSGKLVVDTMNYWPSTDGVVRAFEVGGVGSSEIVAARLPGSTVVKTLNHVGHHDLEDHARPAGSADRRAIGVAGDDAAAVATASELVDRIGYDPFTVGTLVDGRILQPGGPVFGVVLRRNDFARAVQLPEAP